MKMKIFYYIALAMIILTANRININAYAEENITACKIITSLTDKGLMTPAIVENGTFAYSLFEFNLYSDNDNISYSIIVNDILINNGTIYKFNIIFNWNCKQDYISNINITIGIDLYKYTNIFVFDYSVTNQSVFKEPKGDYFTPEELKKMITEIELRSYGTSMVGVIICISVCIPIIYKYKEEKITNVL